MLISFEVAVRCGIYRQIAAALLLLQTALGPLSELPRLLLPDGAGCCARCTRMCRCRNRAALDWKRTGPVLASPGCDENCGCQRGLATLSRSPAVTPRPALNAPEEISEPAQADACAVLPPAIVNTTLYQRPPPPAGDRLYPTA